MPHLVLETNLHEDNLDQLSTKVLFELLDMINSHNQDDLSAKTQDIKAASIYQSKNALSLSSVLHACNWPSHHLHKAMK